MFSGIVQAVGKVERVDSRGPDRRFTFSAPRLGLGDVVAGASLCVSGVCLTVVAVDVDRFDADVSTETLSCTTFGRFQAGTPVNLEKSLAVGDRIGGHFVSGHVDGIGRIASIEPSGRSVRVEIESPPALSRYWARKGSVCVDGTSLTINDASGTRFAVNVIPHTLEQTIFSGYRPGTEVNLEIDLIARYLERLLDSR